MVMLLSKHGWWILFSLCIIWPYEFTKVPKVKMLRKEAVKSSPSAVRDFKRHI